MSDQDDDSMPIVLGVVFGAIALVIALVIGVSVYTTSDTPATATTAAAAADEAYANVAEVGEPISKLYFDLGAATLPANAAGEVAKIVAAFQAKPTLSVLLSGFHDESGALAVNEEVAKSRAKSVKQALIDAGVPADHVLLKKPAVTLGGTDAAEARRVEVRLQ
jgi:outer membrane protein OmpA-like peptidoglycan-associated protein